MSDDTAESSAGSSDTISQAGSDTTRAIGQDSDFPTPVSNLPTGDLMFVDADDALT